VLWYNIQVKLVIGVPSPENIPVKFTHNLIDIMFTTQREVKGLERLDFVYATGVRTDKNRNVIIDKVLNEDFTHILWLDADMIYPADIVKTYLNVSPEPDIIGCLYFKRAYPYDPIGYVKNEEYDPIKPFRYIDPNLVPDNSALIVDGLGFGGVLINLDVYRKMGEDKWMNYGSGFHLPHKNENALTHDLVFCRKAQEYGYKILLHTGVRPSHLMTKEVTIEDWKEANATL